jgi:hypothetical protein
MSWHGTNAPNPSLQATAGRFDAVLVSMKTRPLQFTLVPASGA